MGTEVVETVVAEVLGTVTDADLDDAWGDDSSSSLGFRRSEISTLAAGYLGTQSICATRYSKMRTGALKLASFPGSDGAIWVDEAGDFGRRQRRLKLLPCV